ncbi:uncharacterized protein LOC134239062 [Saccostrea cucullata]|uniref:uncharacterized protein LOC134239062 n=1 Tax=Saccostrea cuccullata TaxID=36930 RepID=UPI002ED3D364
MAASKTKYPLGSPQEHIKMCETHKLPIDVICEDCDEFMCARCAKTDHRDHEWNTLRTAATQRRRGLLTNLKKIKEEVLPGIDEKMVKIPQQITENKELCDSEIKKLQKHVEEIMDKLTEIRKNTEQRLRDNLEGKNNNLNEMKCKLDKKKKAIKEMVKFMEDNNSTMSDYGVIDNYMELTQMLSDQDANFNNFNSPLRYVKGEISDEMMENMVGKTLDLFDINLTEKSSFIHGDQVIVVISASCEDQCYIREGKSSYTEQVTKGGKKKHKYKVASNDMCVTDTGDIYFTDFSNNSISSVSPSGSVSIVVSLDPLEPIGICQSVDGGLLVTLKDKKSDRFKLAPHSRRLVRQVTMTGDFIHDYEYQEDGQTRLFTYPVRVTQNSNSDICVVSYTGDTIGELVIMSPSGHMKSVYRGQNMTKDFKPTGVVCDSLCNILVTDLNNNQIHLLNPDGGFLKFLLTDNEVNRPVRLSLYKSTLWVGYWEGFVKVFQYTV